jgi:alkanesulfonate monooxygenase SsuD/methylene tetrahydromethanopterin reductase-like flavin-dependent oxidoreductase (luciferase family)
VDGEAAERPPSEGIRPLNGSAQQLGAALRELADAGADEAILVLSPINERSVRLMGDALAALGDH